MEENSKTTQENSLIGVIYWLSSWWHRQQGEVVFEAVQWVRWGDVEALLLSYEWLLLVCTNYT